MSDDNNKNSSGSLITEFKRRRVVQFAIGYVVIAWLLVQVADVVYPVYNAPTWALQATITVLILGCPPALILTWLYNLTPSGVELTRDSGWSTRFNARLRNGWVRFLLSLATVLVTGTAVWAVWHTYLEEQRGWIQIVDEDRTPVISVAPIRNLSGDESLDWLGDGVSNLVRDRLAQSRHLIVVSKPRWQAVVREAGADDMLARARDAKIDYVISGELLSAPDGLILTTRVTGTRTGADLRSEANQQLSPEGVLRSVYGISIMAKQALKKPYEEQVDSFAADFAVSNFSAYRAYVSGLQFFLNFDYEQAQNSMFAALELAPEFHIARYRMAMIHWVTSERDKAAEAMRQIPDDALLTDRERGYVVAANAFVRDNDPASAIDLYKELLQKFPYEVEARQYLAEAYFHDYQEDLAIKELKILGEQEPENQFVWGSMGAYLTILGRHEEASTPLQRYLELAPNEPNAHNLMGDLYREMGQFDTAITYFEQALQLEPDFTLSQLGLAEVKAALGEVADAKQRLQLVVENTNGEAEDRITGAFDLAWLLRAEGNFEHSSKVLESVKEEIEAEQIRESMALALRAENANELGDTELAAQLVNLAIEESMRAPTRYLFSRANMEISQGEFASAKLTAEQIRSNALPPDDPDRTEEKAAFFIDGMIALGTGNPGTAVDKIEQSIATEGYRYAIYRRGLAHALFETGDADAARAMATEARQQRDAGSIRLDLERERALALQLEIRLALEVGDAKEADQLISEYERRWGRAELAELRAGPNVAVDDRTE
jgi:tetratricopeptide (TPR) repeat protein